MRLSSGASSWGGGRYYTRERTGLESLGPLFLRFGPRGSTNLQNRSKEPEEK
jgi:hypothetical protein